MIEKTIALVLLIAAAVFAVIAYDPFDLESFDLRNGLRGRHGFSELVSEDFSLMKKKNLLPKAWDSIQYVAYNFHSDFQRALVGNRKFAIKDGPQGRHRLEIEFIDVPDEENPSVILQMSLFDLDSNNKIWEMGRTYAVAPFLKKEGPKKSTDSVEKVAPQAPAPAGS